MICVVTKVNHFVLNLLVAKKLKVIELIFMYRPPLFMCGYSGQRCCVKDVSSIFCFEIEG